MTVGKVFAIGLAGMFVIGILAAGAVVAALIAWEPFGTNRSVGDLSFFWQVVTIGVIPAIVILAGVFPWWMGGFSFPQGLLLSIIVHAVTIGVGMLIQQPTTFFVLLFVGWVVLPVALSSD